MLYIYSIYIIYIIYTRPRLAQQQPNPYAIQYSARRGWQNATCFLFLPVRLLKDLDASPNSEFLSYPHKRLINKSFPYPNYSRCFSPTA